LCFELNYRDRLTRFTLATFKLSDLKMPGCMYNLVPSASIRKRRRFLLHNCLIYGHMIDGLFIDFIGNQMIDRLFIDLLATRWLIYYSLIYWRIGDWQIIRRYITTRWLTNYLLIYRRAGDLQTIHWFIGAQMIMTLFRRRWTRIEKKNNFCGVVPLRNWTSFGEFRETVKNL
jgi:hypothetical protein